MDMIEQALIGSIILRPDLLADIDISENDFSLPDARACFSAAKKLWVDGKPVDLVSVSQAVPNSVAMKWLAESTDIGLPSSAKHYSEQIAEAGRIRRISSQLNNIQKSTGFCGSSEILNDIINLHSSESGASKKDGSVSEVVKRTKQAIADNKKRGSFGFSTGISFLDEKFITLTPGHMWAIGGYTSIGKTTLLYEILRRTHSLSDPHTLVVSTEMSETENVARYAANLTGFPARVILSGGLVKQHQQRVVDAFDVIEGKNITICDDLFEISDIAAECRKHSMRGKLDIVFIDFIQNVTCSGEKSEYAEMRKIAKTIQRLAKDTNACIVCLSQIPNNAAKEDSGILEFKGAGDIAAACDIGVWLKRDKDNNQNILFDIRKNRHGEKGAHEMRFSQNYTRFEEV